MRLQFTPAESPALAQPGYHTAPLLATNLMQVVVMNMVPAPVPVSPVPQTRSPSATVSVWGVVSSNQPDVLAVIDATLFTAAPLTRNFSDVAVVRVFEMDRTPMREKSPAARVTSWALASVFVVKLA